MTRLGNLLQNAYGGLSRETWILSFTQFINRSGSMVIFFLSVYLQEELGMTLQDAGIVMSFYGAGSFIGVFFGGRAVDRFGHRPVMLLSLLGGGIMFLVVSLISDFYLLLLGMFVLSAMAEMFRPAGQVAMSYYAHATNYTRSVSLYRLAINLGFALGPALGGIIALYNYRMIFWVDGATCLLASGLIYYFLKPKDMEVDAEAEDIEEKPASLWRDRPYVAFVPLVTLYGIAFFQFFTTMALYYKNEMQFDEPQIGLLLALNGLLVAIVEVVLIYKIESKGSLYRWIFWGGILLALSYGLLFFAHSYAWFILIIIVISFSEMFAMPFMNTFMNQRSDPRAKGKYASWYVMAWSAAQIITPLLATQIAIHWGYPVLWITLAALSIFVSLGILRIKRMAERERPE
ncbi:MAG: MFS transporter [Flavobacteriales bacterium]